MKITTTSHDQDWLTAEGGRVLASPKLLKPSWFLLCSVKVTSLWIIYGTCHDTALKNAKVSFTGREKKVKQNRVGTSFFPLPHTWKIKQRREGWRHPSPGPLRPALESEDLSEKLLHAIPREACFLHNGLFYSSLWLLISHYELRFWPEPRFSGRKRNAARNVSRAGNGHILLLLKSSRKEERTWK